MRGEEGKLRTLRVSTSLPGKCISEPMRSPSVYPKIFEDSYHLSKPWYWDQASTGVLMGTKYANQADLFFKNILNTNWPVVSTKMSSDDIGKGSCRFGNIFHTAWYFLIYDSFLRHCEVYRQWQLWPPLIPALATSIGTHGDIQSLRSFLQFKKRTKLQRLRHSESYKTHKASPQGCKTVPMAGAAMLQYSHMQVGQEAQGYNFNELSPRPGWAFWWCSCQQPQQTHLFTN